jgi:hypothetical protein
MSDKADAASHAVRPDTETTPIDLGFVGTFRYTTANLA